MFDLNTPEGLQQARQSLAQMTTQTAVTVETEQEAAVESVNQEIPPLTEVETESDELRRYEIERTEHWENYYRKHGKGFPIPIVARQDIQRVVWDRVDEDVLEFKRNLYQI